MTSTEKAAQAAAPEQKWRRVMFLGRSQCGKTTLIQALRNQDLPAAKTQAVAYHSQLLDTPGEYAQVTNLSRALAIFAYEVDIVAMVLAANEDYSLYAPNIVPHINREVIGIVTKTDLANAWPDAAAGWLRNSGCKKIFRVSSFIGDGIPALRDYLQGQP